jgi:hypothetical protein
VIISFKSGHYTSSNIDPGVHFNLFVLCGWMDLSAYLDAVAMGKILAYALNRTQHLSSLANHFTDRAILIIIGICSDICVYIYIYIYI